MKAILVLVVTLVVLASAVSQYAGRNTTDNQQPSIPAADSSSAPAVQSDDEPETAVASSFHAGKRIFNHDGPCGIDLQSAGGL